MAIFSMADSNKNIILAYVFWLFGGIFGLHLFYLGRDSHAFLTWSTLGGYGLGWLADITKIPRYVREANGDPRFIKDLTDRMLKNKKVSKYYNKHFQLTLYKQLYNETSLKKGIN